MNVKSLHVLFLFCLSLSFLSGVKNADASELHYSNIIEVNNTTALVSTKSPAGDQWFLCTISGSCTSTTTSLVSPTILGSHNYIKNAQGTLAVKEIALSTISYYMLYDIHTATPVVLGALPFLTPNMNVRFSPSGNQVVLIKNGTVNTYDIVTKKIKTLKITQTELPYVTLSWNATYLSAYDYIDGKSRIWRIADGKLFEIPTTEPSYVEFSQDETTAAYLNNPQGFKTLYTLAMQNVSSVAPRQITQPATVVEDYIFVGSTLFYLANPDHPLDWNLYAYDPAHNSVSVIDTNISYGDYLKRVFGALAYIKVEGKNANVHLYNPNTKKSVSFATAADSPAPNTVTHTANILADRSTVLIAPKETKKVRSRSGTANLFVWLHGGPARQIAVGYHSYLSYAVYDELLDRLASAGNYVLKIDYTGSTGYGDTFEKALHGNIGVRDVDDVVRVVNAFKQTHNNSNNVYLIGNSYGGYLALRTLVKAPDTFNGAISINGVTDWYGLISRIPSSPFAALFDGVPDTGNLDKYFKASVFIDIPKLTSAHKVLIAYGEDDNEVPTWQSTQYLEYAKSKNISTDVISFPGEQHVLTKRDTLDRLCAKITSYFSLKNVSCTL